MSEVVVPIKEKYRRWTTGSSALEPDFGQETSPTSPRPHLTLIENQDEIDRDSAISAKPQLRVIRNHDLEGVKKLQAKWNRAGIRGGSDGKIDNYNPVLARWNYERAKTPDDKKRFRSEEMKNITTALKERKRTQVSSVRFSILENGKIQNDMMPDEQYEDVLERGLEYRKAQGSWETKREEEEVEGFKQIQTVLADPKTEIGTKFAVMSGPGVIARTAYPHNFVDMYELAQAETGERYIQYTRFASPLGYDAYARIAEELQQGYFEGFEGPVDAWFLGHPIQINADADYKSGEDVFQRHFAKDVRAMEEKAFAELDRLYLPYKLYLLGQITKPDFDPVAIAKAYNALLSIVENKKMQKENDVFVASDATHLTKGDNSKIAAMVDRYGASTVQDIQAGCGRSGGFQILSILGADGNIDWTKTSFAPKNSVAIFGNSVDDYGPRKFECPDCHETNEREYNTLMKECEHCHSKKVAC